MWLKTDKKAIKPPIFNFDEEAYLDANPDVKESIKKGNFHNTIHHLETYGINEIKNGKRKFHKDFEPYSETVYLKYFPDLNSMLEAGEYSDPFDHFCQIGYDLLTSSEKRVGSNIAYTEQSPIEKLQNKPVIEPFFDVEWYQKTFNVYDMSPIEHFLLYGVFEKKNPNPDFDIEWYLETYSDVAESGLNPFVHYIQYGKEEGRFQNQHEKEKAILQKEIDQYFKKDYNKSKFNLNTYSPKKQHKKFFHYLHHSKRGNINKIILPEGVELISLDVWDTILRRKCHPDEIKLSAARFLHLHYPEELKPAYNSTVSLYHLRKKCENLSSLTEDYEFRYDDAVNMWLIEAFEKGTKSEILQEARQKLLEHELKAELRSTEKDIAIDNFLKKIKYNHMIFASDFYMPNQFLKKILRKNEVLRYFTKGYVSCDLIKNKRSGKMYEYILNDFQIQPDQMFHIGDNKLADVDMPLKQGIKTFFYQDSQETSLHKWFDRAFQEKLNGESTLHGERILALSYLTAKRLKLNSKERIGAKIAPVAIGYILFIIEEAKRKKVDTIYFFSREGIFLKELYDLVVEADPYYCKYPRSKLLEVSRLATFAPSLQKVDPKNLMRLWNQYSIQSPKAFCASLNIDNHESKKLFETFGFDYGEEIKYPWKNDTFTKLIASSSFQKIVQKYILLQRKNLIKYLKQQGLNKDQSISMIVDLGWRGTIQDNISMLVDEHIHGCYLGLFSYLNKQRTVSKAGWLFDNNLLENDWTNYEVGPIEMLFNALGGSVVEYRSKGDKIIPIKKEEPEEDKVFLNYTVHFQNGIKKVLLDLIDYIAIHGLSSSDLKAYSREIVKQLQANPPSKVAEAFFELTHNETFGTGKYEKIDLKTKFIKNIERKNGSDLHYYIKKHLESIRWREGFLNIKKLRNSLQETRIDLSNTPLDFYRKTILKDKKIDFKIAVFAPPPISGSGGHRTLFNLAAKFAEAGCEVYCFLEQAGEGIDVAYSYLAEEKVRVLIGWPTDIEVDMAIATIAHSSKHVAALKNAKHKAYLVQDFEAWFNPVGDLYTINEKSYTYGHLHFTVGKFLTHLLHHQYNARAIPAGLGINTNIYYDKKGERENAICFLYQPEKSRRNPQLAIDALKIVKQKDPDVQIYVYGSDADLHLDFEVKNLGLIHDITQLNDLYNRCKVGLCISMTNPSRIPFEFMAAGVVPIDIYRYNNLIDYPSGTIKLAYQSPDSIAMAILQVLKDKDEHKRRRVRCIKFASSRTLDWEMDTFVNNALSAMNNISINHFNIQCAYHEKPVIDPKDRRKEVKAFCRWQKRLATIDQKKRKKK